MPEAILQIMKYLFLFLIFLFLARAVKAMFLEISGPKRPAAQRTSPVNEAVRIKSNKPPNRMVVVADGLPPKTYDISDELIIGRAEKCQVVLTDQYASQIHARVFRKDEMVFVEDMGSTNGTRLNKRKLTGPTPVNRGDSARIGNTELEFRR